MIRKVIMFVWLLGISGGVAEFLFAGPYQAADKKSQGQVASTATDYSIAAATATSIASRPSLVSKPDADLTTIREAQPAQLPISNSAAGKQLLNVDEINGLRGRSNSLDTPFDCSSAVPISCGNIVNGNNSGGTNLVNVYDCAPWNESGPENIYVLTTAVTANISAELSNMTGNLDVFILSACDDAACIAYGETAAFTDCVFPGTYYIIVDGYFGSVSPYTLTVNCYDCGSPPENDDCANALQLTCGTTDEIIEMGGATNSCPWIHDYPDAWYKFYLDPEISACWNVAISYCGTNGSLISIGAILESGCACDNPVAISRTSSSYCSFPAWLPEYFYWDNLAAGWWYLPVFANPVVTVVFDVNCEPCPQRPANDLCENAIGLSVPSSVQGTTGGATNENTTLCSAPQTAPGVWYTVIGTGHTMTASLCNTSLPWDSKITVACGSCGEFACAGYLDDFCGVQSQVSWCSNAGTPYYILVHGFSTESGAFSLDVTDDGIVCSTAIPCGCPPVSDLTTIPSGTNISLRWTASSLGVYRIWTTSFKNPGGDPPENPDWDLIATFPVTETGTQSYLDSIGGGFYRRYAVTYECGAVGRCCYGDVENPSCGDWPRVLCDHLNGTWTSGLTCITACPTGCDLICPPGAITEGEPCPNDPDNFNSGCNFPPYLFSPIACGQTVCGTVNSSASTRDSDWYQFTTTDWSIVRARGTGEVPMQIMIINLNDGCPVTNHDVIAWTQTPQCVEGVCQTTCLAAGTYALWCGCSEFVDHACSDYVLTLECEPCDPPPCNTDFQITAPGSVSGNTCDASNDCLTRSSTDQIVQVTIPAAGTYTFSLCPTGSWDTFMYLDATCCSSTHLISNDDYCGATSEFSYVFPDPGTYYVLIEGFSPSACGPWTLNISSP